MISNLPASSLRAVPVAFHFLVFVTMGWLAYAPELLAQYNTSTVYSTSERGNVGDEELHWAAFLGHVENVRKLLRGGAYVDQKVEKGSTALHMAAYNGHIEVIELLIETGADVNARTRDGITPLDFARRNGHAGAESLLLDHGAKEGKRLPVVKRDANENKAATVASSRRINAGPARVPREKTGEHGGQAQSNPVEDEPGIPIDTAELENLESISRARQIMAAYRAESGSATDLPAAKVAQRDVSPGLSGGAIPESGSGIPSYRVQLAALSDLELAVTLRGRYIEDLADILGGRDLKVEKSSTPDRVLYRIRSVPISESEATMLCDKLWLNDHDCFVVRP